ncbi:hypothetical protein BESB_000950 [Besnoitia besnoiti]|uniref:Uncharacterized protein n=1 Tax=Besnoitia besnoiti TaxID=94643 RepID=A0A2A9MP20_BESBE|nr:hypothetical protein BESB_000950 [Besnoitia besnoiti]PFH37753.1 hypothetical protein BESB_000950 [Besnoitia besnoiti]
MALSRESRTRPYGASPCGTCIVNSGAVYRSPSREAFIAHPGKGIKTKSGGSYGLLREELEVTKGRLFMKEDMCNQLIQENQQLLKSLQTLRREDEEHIHKIKCEAAEVVQKLLEEEKLLREATETMQSKLLASGESLKQKQAQLAATQQNLGKAEDQVTVLRRFTEALHDQLAALEEERNQLRMSYTDIKKALQTFARDIAASKFIINGDCDYEALVRTVSDGIRRLEVDVLSLDANLFKKGLLTEAPAELLLEPLNTRMVPFTKVEKAQRGQRLWQNKQEKEERKAVQQAAEIKMLKSELDDRNRRIVQLRLIISSRKVKDEDLRSLAEKYRELTERLANVEKERDDLRKWKNNHIFYQRRVAPAASVSRAPASSSSSSALVKALASRQGLSGSLSVASVARKRRELSARSSATPGASPRRLSLPRAGSAALVGEDRPALFASRRGTQTIEERDGEETLGLPPRGRRTGEKSSSARDKALSPPSPSLGTGRRLSPSVFRSSSFEGSNLSRGSSPSPPHALPRTVRPLQSTTPRSSRLALPETGASPRRAREMTRTQSPLRDMTPEMASVFLGGGTTGEEGARRPAEREGGTPKGKAVSEAPAGSSVADAVSAMFEGWRGEETADKKKPEDTKSPAQDRDGDLGVPASLRDRSRTRPTALSDRLPPALQGLLSPRTTTGGGRDKGREDRDLVEGAERRTADEWEDEQVVTVHQKGLSDFLEPVPVSLYPLAGSKATQRDSRRTSRRDEEREKARGRGGRSGACSRTSVASLSSSPSRKRFSFGSASPTRTMRSLLGTTRTVAGPATQVASSRSCVRDRGDTEEAAWSEASERGAGARERSSIGTREGIAAFFGVAGRREGEPRTAARRKEGRTSPEKSKLVLRPHLGPVQKPDIPRLRARGSKDTLRDEREEVAFPPALSLPSKERERSYADRSEPADSVSAKLWSASSLDSKTVELIAGRLPKAEPLASRIAERRIQRRRDSDVSRDRVSVSYSSAHSELLLESEGGRGSGSSATSRAPAAEAPAEDARRLLGVSEEQTKFSGAAGELHGHLIAKEQRVVVETHGELAQGSWAAAAGLRVVGVGVRGFASEERRAEEADDGIEVAEITDDNERAKPVRASHEGKGGSGRMPGASGGGEWDAEAQRGRFRSGDERVGAGIKEEGAKTPSFARASGSEEVVRALDVDEARALRQNMRHAPFNEQRWSGSVEQRRQEAASLAATSGRGGSAASEPRGDRAAAKAGAMQGETKAVSLTRGDSLSRPPAASASSSSFPTLARSKTLVPKARPKRMTTLSKDTKELASQKSGESLAAKFVLKIAHPDQTSGEKQGTVEEGERLDTGKGPQERDEEVQPSRPGVDKAGKAMESPKARAARETKDAETTAGNTAATGSPSVVQLRVIRASSSSLFAAPGGSGESARVTALGNIHEVEEE